MDTSFVPILVIVPAHNEESVIRRCLDAITVGSDPGELEVIVVCNGCTDSTAAIVASYGPPVRLVEIDIASKSEALNFGDRVAHGFPRFFVDADVVIPLRAIRETANVLVRGEALAAAPRFEADCTKSSLAVRMFYRAWMSLPYFDDGMIGSGVYAVSVAGRARFKQFPDIIADDGYLRLLFKPGERRTIATCKFTVTPPRTLDGVIHIKTRARAGLYELREKFPGLLVNETGNAASSLLRMLSKPHLWPCYVVYLYATLQAGIQGRRKLNTNQQNLWERDESSR
jgi:glycosyltransferase involved in cell wall biosynthesis